MLRDYLYIHLDAISNSILSKGMTHEDFNRYTLNRPHNILLLDPYDREGEYEAHTGFRVIRGENNVEQYFSLVENRAHREIKWLDFQDYDVLKRLTPNDISELLYFGHMKNQLRSPFFFKLQNDYAFFEIGQDVSKVYYRNIEEFYHSLSRKITDLVLKQLNGNRNFFSRKINSIPSLPEDMVSHLKGAMQEGIVFNFSQIGFEEGQYVIPIHVVEDNLRKVENYTFEKEEKIGTLIYDDASKEWRVKKEQFESIFLTQ
ncbi:MAG: hypothetical protein ACTJHC_04440 [Vagococcus sp.]